jgi:PAS domain S-box-containing protein
VSESIEELRARLAAAEDERDALRALVDVLPVGVTSFSTSGTVIAHNRSAAESAVFPEEHLLGASIEQLALMSGLEPEQLRIGWQDLPEGLSEQVPYTLTTPEGDERVVRVKTFRHHERVFTISEDITDARIMLSRLQDSKERLRRFFEASVEGIVFRHGPWITDANPAAARMFGMPVEKLRGRPILDFVAPEERARGMRLMAQSPTRYRIRACRSDESTFPIDVQAQQIGDSESGRRVICFSDISQEEEAKRRLRESNALFEALSRAAPVGLITLSPERDCRYANDAWTELTGQDAEQAAGQGWKHAIPDEDRPICEELLAIVRTTRQPSAREYRVCRPDGAVRWVFGQFAPLLDSHRQISGFVGTLTDITGRKNADEERARTLKQKELLLQEIHHRVKNNLLLISSLLLLQAQEFSDPVLRTAFDSSQARIKAMALLHSNLYSTTSVDRVSFGTYTTRLVRSLIASIGRPDVLVHVNVVLEGEDDLNIQQAIPCGLILNELLTNSFKHAFPPPRGGNIWLQVWRDGPRWHLCVRDDGIGHPPDARASLGSRLIEMLTMQLGGTLTVSNGPQGGSQTDLEF